MYTRLVCDIFKSKMCLGDDTEQYHSALASCEETAGKSWPYPRWHVVSGRRAATRVHVCEVRGYGVAYSAGPGEALANRRYGIKGGVSAGGSRTTRVGSVEERRLRPLPSSSPLLGSAGSPLS